MAVCIQCQGMGVLEGDYPPCPMCGGRGHEGNGARCQYCNGSGKDRQRRKNTCWNCLGSGRVKVPPSPKVTPPADKKKPKSRPDKKTSSKPSKDDDTPSLMDRAGLVLAAMGGIGGVIWGRTVVPDTPVAWFIIGAIAAVFAFGLRKLIIVGVVVLGGLWLINNSEGEDNPAQVTGTVPLVEDVTVSQPVANVPRGHFSDVIGFCLSNGIERAVTYHFDTAGSARSDSSTLQPGERHRYWKDKSWLDSSAKPFTLFLTSERAHYDLKLGVASLAHDGPKVLAKDLVCGAAGLPDFSIEHEGAELIIRW